MDETTENYITDSQFYLGMQELKLDTIAEVRNEILASNFNGAKLVNSGVFACYAIGIAALIAAVGSFIGNVRKAHGRKPNHRR